MAHPKTGLVKGDLGALFSLYYTKGQMNKQSHSFIADQLTCASFLMFILNSALLTALKASRRWDPNMQLLACFLPGRVLRHYTTSEMRLSYWRSKPKLPHAGPGVVLDSCQRPKGKPEGRVPLHNTGAQAPDWRFDWGACVSTTALLPTYWSVWLPIR